MGRNTPSRRFKDDDIGGVDSALDAEGVGQRRSSARSADQGRPVRMVNGPGRERFLPVLARTRSILHSVGPVAYDCVKLIFVRHGSAILFSEFCEQPATTGDVVLLGANTLCGSEPEGSITVTTLYLDRDYVIDQVFWAHAAVLADRWEAQDFFDERFSEPAQILHLGEDCASMLMPWLDEMVALRLDGPTPGRFYRLQALLFAVLDVITPLVATTPLRQTSSKRKATRPGMPRHRRFIPLRAAARQVADLMGDQPARRCTLPELAAATPPASSDKLSSPGFDRELAIWR